MAFENMQNQNHSKKTNIAVSCAELLAVMGEKPCAITANKAALMIERDNSTITGFILTSPTGLVGVVDKCAVRWLNDKEMWWLMHDSPTPIIANP